MTAISKICNLILWAAAAAVLSASCVRDEEGIDCAQMPEVTLRLSTVAANTRADESDNVEEDEYAQNPEESISRVDLFFYTSAESTEAPLYVYETTLNATTKTDLTVKIPIELKQQFPDNKGYVYALVNLPAAVRVDASDKKVDGASATLENLQKVWVEENAFVGKDAPANFVMRGGGVITLQQSAGGATSASGTVLLERLASKIRLWASLPEVVYVDENGRTIVRGENEEDADWQERIKDAEKWVPIPSGNKMDGSGSDEYEQMKLYIYNVATTGRLDATTTETETGRLIYGNVERESGNKINEKARKLVKGDDLELPAADIFEKFPYSHTTAYYSYPNVWDSTSPEEEHQTYVIVSLLWGRVGADNSIELYQPCYYQVPVNALKQSDTDAERDCLEPNKYYRIKVNISMLGSKDLGDPLPVEASWEVVDWVPAEVDVNIKSRRYLVVNEKNWVMNNASTIEIPFSTSHETVVDKCYVTYFRYNDVWGTEANSREVYSVTLGGMDYLGRAAEHNSNEFTNWVNKAGEIDEGEIWTTVDNRNTMLYYKKEYFYDNVLKRNLYYVGHEHPKTFQHDRLNRTQNRSFGMGQNSDDDKAWQKYYNKYGIDSIYTYTVDREKGVIRFTHPLVQWKEVNSSNNRRYYAPMMNPHSTDNLWDEFSRCEIVIKIKHKDWENDDDLYRETIHITQYPAMYVEVSHNYGSISTRYSTGLGPRYGGGNEYVSVNGLTAYDTDGKTTVPQWEIGAQGAFGVTNSVIQYNGTNMNPNMYVIHISQISEEDEHLYDIGDPGSLTSNINLSDASFGYPENDKFFGDKNESNRNSNVNQPWIHWEKNYGYTVTPDNKAPVTNTSSWLDGKVVSNKNTLQYYYPADETTGSGSKENFVAPVIRIASSFGKIQRLERYEARRRCAAYQEAGRPAGRWRLPTKAEVKYIAGLSSDEKIPILFGNVNGSAAQYWTATGMVVVTKVNGRFEVKDTDTNDGTQSVRCVYDDWYWINKETGDPDVTTDAPRETTFYWGDRPKDNTQSKSIMQKTINKKPIQAVKAIKN